LSLIHPTAIIDPGASIGKGTKVGPFSIIEAGAKLGEDCLVESHAVIRGNVTLGDRNVIGQCAIVGGDPQDRKYSGEETYLKIGNDNVFREFVTLHRGTGAGKSTVIGDDNFLMAFTHIGHNCTIHDHVTIANSCGISGHVTIEDRANIGGMTGVHQYVRIGKLSMIGAMSGVGRDVPPFMLTEGRRCRVYDINAIGLRRLGFSSEVRMALHKACKIIYRSDLPTSDAIAQVRAEVEPCAEVDYLIAFIENIGEGRFGRQDQK
jgi:UDP-N-acetylglucosamine acyltransferase